MLHSEQGLLQCERVTVDATQSLRCPRPKTRTRTLPSEMHQTKMQLAALR